MHMFLLQIGYQGLVDFACQTSVCECVCSGNQSMHASMLARVVRIGPSSPTAFAFGVDMQPAMDGRDADFTPKMYDLTRKYRAHMMWLQRLHMDDDTQRVLVAHRRFDEACTHLGEMENRTALMHRLMPGSQHQGIRKVLSHVGGLGRYGEHDPNNWHWGVFMKAFLYQCQSISVDGSFHQLRWVMRELNDEKQGDHWEAILGLEVWSRNDWTNAPLSLLHLPFLDIRTIDLVEYALWINEAMFLIENIIIPYLVKHRFISDTWSLRMNCTSREAAAFLA